MIKEIKCVLTKPVSALRQLRDKINEVVRKVNDIDANGTAGGGSGGSVDASAVLYDVVLSAAADTTSGEFSLLDTSGYSVADIINAHKAGKICRILVEIRETPALESKAYAVLQMVMIDLIGNTVIFYGSVNTMQFGLTIGIDQNGEDIWTFDMTL